MKRLFTLKCQNGQYALSLETGKPMFFGNKMEAKKERDRRNSGYKISKSVDHHNFKG